MSSIQLQMNYEPLVVVDTENLSREDWLSYRKLGIGGSDVAAIMGVSPFATIRDLDLCQYIGHKKLKGYADFFNSSSSFCCGVI